MSLEPDLRLLGCEISFDLLRCWVEWFAPARQPFLVDADCDATTPVETSNELRDTYLLYGDYGGTGLLWLDEGRFGTWERPRRASLVREQMVRGRGLVPSVRRWGCLGATPTDQADGHRFVWWPSLLQGREVEVLAVFINEGRRPSRHDEVPERVWDAASEILPGARQLAGTFPRSSGPNCFGTVMAAGGDLGAKDAWMQREPFEDWLATRCISGGQDRSAGTVLVWRSADGAVEHAAVTLGEGWALHKPSQGWMSPTKVLAVADAMLSARARGLRVQRYRLR